VFTTEDMEALNVIFIPASSADEVIPDVKGKSYVASTNLSELILII